MGGSESSKRMLGMLMGAQAETLTKASFAGWQEIVYFAKLDRLKEQSMKMRSKEDESRRRMLTMLMGSQESLLLKSSFSAWSECIYTARQMRATEQMRRDMKSKGDESTKRMLGMLMNSQAETLLKGAFASWHELTSHSITLRMRADLKSKKDEGSRRMLGMLLGSQAELMQKAMFTAWHEMIIALKQQREIERVKQGMKAKGSESTKRMLAMMMGSQMETLKKSTFAGWWEHVHEEKQHDAMRKMQQGMKARGAESSKRMLGMLMGAQAETLVKASFAGWLEVVYSAKMDRLKEQSMKMRSKEDESRRRMLVMLTGSQGNMLLKTSFTAWSECIYQLRQQRAMDEVKRDMKSRGEESTKSMLGMLMNSQAETLVKGAFASWRELAAEASTLRMRQLLKSKKDEGSRRMLGMLLGSQAELMQKAAFTAWHEIIIGFKQQREIDRVKQGMKAKGSESTKRMLAMMMGSQMDA